MLFTGLLKTQYFIVKRVERVKELSKRVVGHKFIIVITLIKEKICTCL